LRAELLTCAGEVCKPMLTTSEGELRQRETALEAVSGRAAAAGSGTGNGPAAARGFERRFQRGPRVAITRPARKLADSNSICSHQRELRQRREEDWRQVETALEQIEAQLAQDRIQEEEWARR
jgi:hypothetical protein